MGAGDNAGYRIETDLIGPVKVPVDALYGGQTQRAIDLYPLKGEKSLADYPQLLRAMLQVKQAATLANLENGELAADIAGAMLAAIDKLLSELPRDQFPVHAFHGGGGVSTNMNVNEVIANLANRDHFAQPPGSYAPVHPNDHANLNNSTSDAQSSACHMAVISQWQGMQGALDLLAATFDDQAESWQNVQKISRTCLQDAVEIGYGDFYSGYASLVKRNRDRLASDVDALYAVNLGGNIIGRKGDCSEAFLDNSMQHLNAVLGSDKYRRSDNLFDASQNHDELIRVASGLDQLARGLIRIAKDIRLMASGPQTGLSELILPAVQPGSSAMPGKVNPTIPEYLIHCAMQASGRCHTALMTHDHGELDYSPWQALVVNNILDAMSVLQGGIEVFVRHCLAGIEPNIERNHANVNTLIPTIIRLKQQKGYSFASKVFKESGGDLEVIRSFIE